MFDEDGLCEAGASELGDELADSASAAVEPEEDLVFDEDGLCDAVASEAADPLVDSEPTVVEPEYDYVCDIHMDPDLIYQALNAYEHAERELNVGSVQYAPTTSTHAACAYTRELATVDPLGIADLTARPPPPKPGRQLPRMHSAAPVGRGVPA